MPLPDWLLAEGGVLRSALAANLLGYGASEIAAGDRFGAFELRQEIGRGGQAAVFLADRVDGAYRQQVAIKIALGRVGSRDFARERQLLAELKHPNLARLIDGGDQAGRLWFAMDHVDGPPIDRYCAEHRLDRRQRIELFLQVCVAVSFAHQRLLVHRDIKPSNVLVDADGTPKLLDFGIAALLSSDDQGESRRAYTPAYASPEQLEGAAVGPGSDQYQLALLLQRMLDDAAPETAQPLTSTLATQVDATTAVPRAATRTSELGPELRAVLTRASAHQVEARYGSVVEFADDLQRYLQHRPVRALRATPIYVGRKALRRHPWRFASAALALTSLVVLVTAFTLRLAEERDVSRVEAARAEAIKDFLIGMFRDGDPTRGSDPDLSARELVQAGVARVEADQSLPLDARRELLQLLVDIQLRLGDGEHAGALLERLDPAGIDPASFAEMQGMLASIRGQPDNAAHYYEQAIAYADTPERQLRLLRADNDAGRTAASAERLARLLQTEAELPDALAASAWIAQGVLHWRDGKPEEALLDYDRALMRAERSKVAISPVAALINRGLALNDLGRFDEALADYDRAERGLTRFPNFRHQGLILQNRGMSLLRAGEVETAKDVWLKLLALVDEGVNPGIEASTVHNLAAAVDRLGDPIGSIAYSLRAERLRRQLGDLPSALSSKINVSVKLHTVDLAEEGIRMAESAVADALAIDRPDLAARARLAVVNNRCSLQASTCIGDLEAVAAEFAATGNRVKLLETLENIGILALERGDRAAQVRAADAFAEEIDEDQDSVLRDRLVHLRALASRDIDVLSQRADASSEARRALVLLALERADLREARRQMDLLPEQDSIRYWALRERVAQAAQDAGDVARARAQRTALRTRVLALLQK